VTEWQSARLGDLCKIDIGKTPSRGVSRYWDKGRETDNVWLSIADLTQSQGGQIYDSKEYVSDEAARSLKPVKAGTLLMSFKLSIGKMAVAGRDLFTNEAIAALTIIDSKSMSREYLQYFLSGYDWEAATAGDHKVKGKTLNKAKLKELNISFPPPTEQQRIVGILDQAFEGIAKAKANAERNLANAKELLSQFRAEKFNILLDSCPAYSLGDLCHFENGDRSSNYPSKQHRVPSGIPFVNAGHLSRDGIDFSDMDYISEERFNLLRNGKIRPNDILFCLRGSLGKFACVGELETGAIASSLVIIRPKPNVNLGYLLDYLASPLCASMIRAFEGGTAQPNLGAKDLMKFSIPLPDMNLQVAVSQEIKSLSEQSARLELQYSEKIRGIADLQKSILHQAFSGNL